MVESVRQEDASDGGAQLPVFRRRAGPDKAGTISRAGNRESEECGKEENMVTGLHNIAAPRSSPLPDCLVRLPALSGCLASSVTPLFVDLMCFLP